MSFAIVVRVVVLIVCLLGLLTAEGMTYEQFCGESANMLCNRKMSRMQDDINALNEVIKTSDGEMLASALIVKAALTYASYEDTMRITEMKKSAELSQLVMAMKDIPDTAWQKSVAALMLAITKATDGDYLQAYDVCKESFERSRMCKITNGEKAIWDAFCKRNLVPNLSVYDALNFYAALSLLMYNSSADIHDLVIALPKEALEKIDLVIRLRGK